MAEVVRMYPAIYELIRWAGVLYLLWLAVDCWRNGTHAATQPDASAVRAYFRHGFIVNILNPKAAMFYLAVLPAYLPPSYALWQALMLAGISVMIATLAHMLIVLFAARLRPWFDRPERQKTLRKVFALLLGLVALWFAVSSRA
jgi:threonine/homoserine/homoserine lactone efflux protein